MTAIDQVSPGVHDLTDEQYFGPVLASTTLSSTGVRELLPPSCPARFFWNRRFGRRGSKAFDLGHAAHRLVLGVGPELVLIPAAEWRSDAVKAQVAEVRTAGGVPLKAADWDAVHGMAGALQAHPFASKLLSGGVPERTLIWRDDETGVMCRAKVDWLAPDGIVDYKTCDKASPEHLRKAVHNYGYHIQAAFYLRGFRAVLPVEVPFFAFVAQEKDPPYLVTVFQLTQDALDYGDRQCADALQIYRDCSEANEWPGYTADIEDIGLPPWVRTEEW